MPDPGPNRLDETSRRMIRAVGEKQSRLLRARSADAGFWSSIQVLGTVGWSIALPTLLGVALGVFLDRRWPTHFSWTVSLLLAGLVFGCVNAWTQLRGK